MAAVVFDIDKFREIYPEFSNVSDSAANFLFQAATYYLDNSAYSVVTDETKREFLLYLLMAHLAAMQYGDNSGNGGNGTKGMVGRLASASEGTVSVSSALDGADTGSSWFTQTMYGYNFWTLTSVYRRGVYYTGEAVDPIRWRRGE